MDINNEYRFRKKPVIIEAFQWTIDEVPEWWINAKGIKVQINNMSAFIPTLEGIMEAKAKDFIIKGIEGEIYPCKPDIFSKTYESLQPSTLPLIDQKDLHQQVVDHIRNYNLFDWDEALTGNEMSLLEDMFMSFNPLCPPGSIGFEEQKRHIQSVPLIDKGEPEETVTELCEEGQNLIWLLLPAQKYQGNKDAGRLWEILETIKIKNNDTNTR